MANEEQDEDGRKRKQADLPEWTTMRPNADADDKHTEHAYELSGMAQSTSKGTAQLEKDRAAEGSLENLRAKRIEGGEDPDAPVTRAATTSWTEGDERLLGDTREGSTKPRTPQEMSFTEEISREPVGKKREGHVADDTGRGGA